MTTGIDDVRRVVPVDDLPPGTGVLATGPPLSGLDRLGVSDGAGDPDRTAALVSEETTPGGYTGFWTYRADVVGAVDEYLRSTYW